VLPARTAAFALLLVAASAWGTEIDWGRVEHEAASLLSEYIRIDTTNPPGNEASAAEFLAARLRAEGLEVRLFESQPGRASVLGRLQGRVAGASVVLLNHLDVVVADADGWAHPPFDGVITGGYVHGRGALDCKGPAVIQLMALITMKRAGIVPSRDVLFLGTADEEAGGKLGAGWFVEHEMDALGHAEFVLTEGGAIRQRADDKAVFEVAVAEKAPLWLRLTTRGQPGHGSTPRGESAVARLVRALERVRQFHPQVRVVPEVEAYYRGLAALQAGVMRDRYRDIGAALEDPRFREAFLREPRDAALVRNTISMTVLHGSEKTNVVPAEASAELDCRLLPGEDPQGFIRRLKDSVGDDEVQFEVLLNFPASSSPTRTALYRAIESVAAAEGAPVVPTVLRGFTDSHYFREHGLVSYGFIPVVLSEEEERGEHGVNERISIANLREGTRRLVGMLGALDAAEESPHAR